MSSFYKGGRDATMETPLSWRCQAEDVEAELTATSTHLQLHDEGDIAYASHRGFDVSMVQQLLKAYQGRARHHQRRAKTGTSI